MENGYEGCGAFHLSRDIDINAQGVSSRRDSHNVVGGEDDYDSGGEERGVHTVRSGKGGTGVGRTKNNYIEVDAGVEAGDEQDTEDKDLLLDKTSLRLAIFGSLNVIYVTAQLTGSMLFGSLVLLSDGFHNLSDVAAIGMAMYIHKLQRRRCLENEDGGSDRLPFGYKRSEVIGGLINGVALVSLSCYELMIFIHATLAKNLPRKAEIISHLFTLKIMLTALPRLVAPTEVDAGWPYIILTCAGILVNLAGVLFFVLADGDEHDYMHPGGFLHAHSHGHDHGHEVREASRPDSLGLLAPGDPPGDMVAVSPSSSDDIQFGGQEQEVSVVLAGSGPPLMGLGGTGDRIEEGMLDTSTSMKKKAFLLGGEENGGTAVSLQSVRSVKGDVFRPGCRLGDSPSCSSRGTAPNSDGSTIAETDRFGRGKGRGCSKDDGERDEDRSGEEDGWVGGGGGDRRHGGITSSDRAQLGGCSIHQESTKSNGACSRRQSHAAGASFHVGNKPCHDHVLNGNKGCKVNGSSLAGVADRQEHHYEVHSHQHHDHSHSHSHSHGHGHARGEEGHGHGHVHVQGCGHGHGGGWSLSGGSMNISAVMVHAAADAASAAVLCIQGLVIHFFGRPGHDWTDYLDPVTSILLSMFIIMATMPIIRKCAHVLLEGTPEDVDVPRVRSQLIEIRGVSRLRYLSFVQLNSEEKHVASVRVVLSKGADTASSRGGRSPTEGDHEVRDRVLNTVKEVLEGHNVGRSTVEIVPWTAEKAEGEGKSEASEGRRNGGECMGPSMRDRAWQAERGLDGEPARSQDRHSSGSFSEPKCNGHSHSHEDGDHGGVLRDRSIEMV